jgi:predicted nucleic acid-binding protein
MIAAIAIHHDAELITFDTDFKEIGKVCDLRLKLLQRPTP